jgi:hypothetical protein
LNVAVPLIERLPPTTTLLVIPSPPETTSDPVEVETDSVVTVTLTPPALVSPVSVPIVVICD